MADGEQFVMMTGTSEMLVLSADSLVFQMPWLLTRVVICALELDRFGLTMLDVEVMSHRYFHADMQELEVTTVITAKTLVFAVETLEVRMNDTE